MSFQSTFDVIVVGGGHAGTEAALAAARMGCDTLLLTHNIETIGQMSCNPSIGGIGKSHLVKEIDALGGIMGIATDESGIQFRVLNASKGPAVRATRAQTDRILYKQAIRKRIENQPHLVVMQQSVDDLMIERDQVVGVITQLNISIRARAVILTVGTFLAGLAHIGRTNFKAGRAGDPPSLTLAQRLRDMEFPAGRLKRVRRRASMAAAWIIPDCKSSRVIFQRPYSRLWETRFLIPSRFLVGLRVRTMKRMTLSEVDWSTRLYIQEKLKALVHAIVLRSKIK